MQITQQIRPKYPSIYIMMVLLIFFSCGQNHKINSTSAFSPSKPNIVLIMCDDMGFSDLGCYGSEIKTPNIDALAKNGTRFSQFKNTGRCCPSRAALLTGRNQHAVNMGWMTAVDEHREGYRGQISDSVPTIAELLKNHGYTTYLSGKWHLSLNDSFMGDTHNPNGSWPLKRGFDATYGGLSGGGGYRWVNALYKNDSLINSFPKDYYYTHAITKNAVKFIKDHDTHNPLFLYLAHYAPHRPLQAPKDRINSCMERYKVGYDSLRKKRFESLKVAGLIPYGFKLPIHEKEFNNNRPLWESLNEAKQHAWILEMATYAAMIEIMDDGIGEVVNAIKQKGLLDNTLFIFLSDNGATSEGGEISQLAADLSNTPYRNYKQFTYMGGTSSPLIISYPKLAPNTKGEISNGIAHITDILPTCLDISGVEYPKKFKEKPLSKVHGTSLKPLLLGKTLETRNLYFEHQSSCAVISNAWKLVRQSKVAPWELINLKNDPFEQNDVSAMFPEKVHQLETYWNDWAKANNVFPLENKPWNTRIDYYNAQYQH